MTYKQLINLKYGAGVTTHELMRRFPTEVERVSEIALLDVPENTLREIIQEETTYNRLIKLKRQFFG